MMKMASAWLFLMALLLSATPVQLGVDVLLEEQQGGPLHGKRVGLITNHTGVDGAGRSTIDLFKARDDFKLVALFGPEHGLQGNAHAEKAITDARDSDGIPIYSLYGGTRRPTEAMLQGLDVLVFDVQDIGTRCYTYASTLFYAMEEAAKHHVPVVVLDRPNPINGVIVDGPMLEEKWRSFVGYINVPFCHGMTIGELAHYFNAEYDVGCELTVVPMRGWKREMSFADTGLSWVPTSPQIPEPDTPLYYPSTVILGETMTMVSIGVGYTLPFKLIGAPWIDAESLAAKLNEQQCQGVLFHPYHFRPFFGRYAGKDCHGVRIAVTDATVYRPVSTQFILMGVIKTLYPQQFVDGMPTKPERLEFLKKISGSEAFFAVLQEKQYIAWELIGLDQVERDAFLERRQKVLMYR